MHVDSHVHALAEGQAEAVAAAVSELARAARRLVYTADPASAPEHHLLDRGTKALVEVSESVLAIRKGAGVRAQQADVELAERLREAEALASAVARAGDAS